MRFSQRIEKEFFEKVEFKRTAFQMVNEYKRFTLSNYIKSVKTVINFVDNSGFDLVTKNKYLNIFFSQFTLHEITIINYFIKLGEDEDLKRYFNKYNVLGSKDKHYDSLI